MPQSVVESLEDLLGRLDELTIQITEDRTRVTPRTALGIISAQKALTMAVLRTLQ